MGLVEGLSEAQIALRRTGITASDAVILSGSSRWGTPLEVWESKMGAPAKVQTIAMAMGHAAEPVVMGLVAQKFGLRMWPGATVRHRIMRHFIATPDRFVNDSPVFVGADDCLPSACAPEATCEGKLVGWHLVKEWHDESDPTGKTLVFPDSVAVQTAWQMGVTSTRRNYVGALLGGWRDEDFHSLAVDFNEDLWLGVVDVCDRFWTDHVLAGVPPTPDSSERDTEVLSRIFPAIKRPVLAPASDEQAARMRRYLEINATLSGLEAEKKALGNMLRLDIGDAEGLRAFDLKATWTPQAGRVDAKRLAEHFGLSEQQINEFRSESSRVLRVSKLNKKEQGYAAAIHDLVAE